MIAVMWAINGNATVQVDASPTRVAMTWRAVRPSPGVFGHGYEPLGESRFQARLYPSGEVQFSYLAAPERDGIVGLFNGVPAPGRTLDSVDDAVGDVASGVLDIVNVEWVDNGITLLARLTLAEEIPAEVTEGTISYRVGLRFAGTDCAVSVDVNASGRRAGHWCGPAPRVAGFLVRGATIEIPISKTLLNGSGRFVWNADAVWWGMDRYDQVFLDREVRVEALDRDLGSLGRDVAGSVFEVFHNPVVPKAGLREILSYIYEEVPPDDEIAVTFTDFRFDDLFSGGPGTGPINQPVQGIGHRQANPGEGEPYGSHNLLVSMAPVFVGAPYFGETGVAGSDNRAFRNFAPGVRWITHEATHRWAAHLEFRNPLTGAIEDLLDGGCRCHWSYYLNAPAVHPVWRTYSSDSYVGRSLMGGRV